MRGSNHFGPRRTIFGLPRDTVGVMTGLHYITAPNGARLALSRQTPQRPWGRAVLVVHGATFGTSLSGAYRIGGRSWFDELSEAGFETWGLDFQGFGASDRYAEGDCGSEPGRAPDAAAQLGMALQFVRRESTCASLALVAHSWGTLPAGVLLAGNPGLVERAVFYGPVVAAQSREPLAATMPAFLEMTRDLQWGAFAAGVPKGMEPPIGSAQFERWIKAYLEGMVSVRVPAGPAIDIECARRGALPYDPGRIETPMLVIRGSWDAVTTEADSIRFFQALSQSQEKQLTWIHGGTHRMHLESCRSQLYRAVEGFLKERP